MEALDLIERRVDALSRMLGPVPEENKDESVAVDSTPSAKSSETNLVDSLIFTHSLLESAIGTSEPVKKMVERADELENLLEPRFIEEQQQSRSKQVYLNAALPELSNQFEQLQLIKQLEPALGAEYFRNIPNESNKKLKQVGQDNEQFAIQTELIEGSIVKAMKRCGELQTNLMAQLNGLNERLELLEERLLKKKAAALERPLDFPKQADA